MAKQLIYRPRVSNKKIREQIKFYYTEKFFNKWMNKYTFHGLNYQQSHYFMKKMWSQGTIAVSDVKTADKNLAGLIDAKIIDMKESSIILTPWIFSNRYNIYDFPTHIRLVNTRGVKFITTKELELDKEAVIIWAQKNHKSVFSSIEAKLNELVDIEMKKRVARKSQSQPWMFLFSPEDYEQAKILEEQLENDSPYMYVPVNDANSFKGVSSGAPYVVDKFEQDRQKVENDILTMLGCNNVGVSEKKEHLTVNEVDANNQDIQEQEQVYQDEIREGWERANKVLECNIDVEDNSPVMEEYVEDKEEDNEDEQDLS